MPVGCFDALDQRTLVFDEVKVYRGRDRKVFRDEHLRRVDRGNPQQGIE
jgi:hypothetical protein